MKNFSAHILNERVLCYCNDFTNEIARFIKATFLTCIMVYTCGFNVAHAQSGVNFNSILERFIADPKLKGAHLGVDVRDMADGKILMSHNANLILTPASIHKLVVTATAIDELGPNFRFKTELLIDGPVVQDTLKGNIIIKGSGDPTLCSSGFSGVPGLNDWLKQIQELISAKGIKAVEGHIIVDGSFSQVYPEQGTWQWIDLGNYYASGSWGLNIADNLYTITFRQASKIGEIPAIIKIEPEIPGLVLVNEVATAARGTGDNAYVFGAPHQQKRFVRGTIPAGTGVFTIKGSMPDPEYFAAYSVYRHLVHSGILVSGKYYTHRDTMIESKDPRTLKIWESPVLEKIISYANSTSNNLISEALLYQLGSKLKSGKFKYDGSTSIIEWLNKLGLKDSLFFIEDGSGLSLKNGYTPANFGLFLYNFKTRKHFKEWQNGLPLAGKDGTVRSFLPNRSAKSVVRVKSGTLSRVRCYAGYIRTNSGKELSFVVMANQFVCSSSEVRQKMELLLTELTKL